MNKSAIGILLIMVLITITTPIALAKPCVNWTPATTMPLYVTAMGDTNALAEQLQTVLANIEDPSQYAEHIQAISDQIALAAQGANFVHKKDQVLVAKQMLEDLLATL